MASRLERLLSKLQKPTRAAPDPAQMYPLLEHYAHALEQAGLGELAEKLAQDSKAAMAEAPLCNLGEPTNISVKDAAAEMVTDNVAALETETGKTLCQSALWIGEEMVCRPARCTAVLIHNGLTSYCSLLKMVKFDNRTTSYVIRLTKGPPAASGWKSSEDGGYPRVNVPNESTFRPLEQAKVVFGFSGIGAKRPQMTQFLEDAQLKWAENLMKSTVKGIYGDGFKMQLMAFHVLFGFSFHVNYSYHKDKTDMPENCQLTFMVNLSPGESSAHIAGAASECKYTFPGDMVLFDAENVWHRSGTCTMRTVKIAFFVRVSNVVELEDDTNDAAEEGEDEAMAETNTGEEEEEEDEVEEEEEEQEEQEQEVEPGTSDPGTSKSPNVKNEPEPDPGSEEDTPRAKMPRV